MNEPLDITVVLPSYLEEENLRLILPRIHSELKSLTQKYEILVIDTPVALDGTPKVCEENHVTYVNRLGGDFYGAAVRTGIKLARGEYILFMDSDGSHPPTFIKNMWLSKDNMDLVVASRYIKGGITENSWHLILMSRMVNWGYGFFLGINCKDISNSFKLYRTKYLKGLQLTCNNFDIIEEILYKLIKGNPKFLLVEIPFTFKERMFGKTKRNLVAFVFSYLYTLFRLRFLS